MIMGLIFPCEYSYILRRAIGFDREVTSRPQILLFVAEHGFKAYCFYKGWLERIVF